MTLGLYPITMGLYIAQSFRIITYGFGIIAYDFGFIAHGSMTHLLRLSLWLWDYSSGLWEYILWFKTLLA